MSSTTTIRMPEDLKSRVHSVAKQAGLSAHALILQAVEEKAERLERQAKFYDEADQSFKNLAETGEKISWDDMQVYLKKLISGDENAKPEITKMATDWQR